MVDAHVRFRHEVCSDWPVRRHVGSDRVGLGRTEERPVEPDNKVDDYVDSLVRMAPLLSFSSSTAIQCTLRLQESFPWLLRLRPLRFTIPTGAFIPFSGPPNSGSGCSFHALREVCGSSF